MFRLSDLKFKVREAVVKAVKLTPFEWSQLPIEKNQEIFICMRDEFKVKAITGKVIRTCGLELRFGKLGSKWFGGFPYERLVDGKKRYCTDYFTDNEIEAEFYPFLIDYTPTYIEILTQKDYKKHKRITKFISNVKKLCPKAKVRVLTAKDITMFT